MAEQQIPTPGIFNRGASFLLDAIIFGITVRMAQNFLGGGTPTNAPAETQLSLQMLLVTLVASTSFIAYRIFTEFNYGSSLPKALSRQHVVTLNTQPPSFGQIAIRNSYWILLLLAAMNLPNSAISELLVILTLFAQAISIQLSPLGQSLTDRWAGTTITPKPGAPGTQAAKN